MAIMKHIENNSLVFFYSNILILIIFHKISFYSLSSYITVFNYPGCNNIAIGINIILNMHETTISLT